MVLNLNQSINLFNNKRPKGLLQVLSVTSVDVNMWVVKPWTWHLVTQ